MSRFEKHAQREALSKKSMRRKAHKEAQTERSTQRSTEEQGLTFIFSDCHTPRISYSKPQHTEAITEAHMEVSNLKGTRRSDTEVHLQRNLQRDMLPFVGAKYQLELQPLCACRFGSQEGGKKEPLVDIWLAPLVAFAPVFKLSFLDSSFCLVYALVSNRKFGNLLCPYVLQAPAAMPSVETPKWTHWVLSWWQSVHICSSTVEGEEGMDCSHDQGATSHWLEIYPVCFVKAEMIPARSLYYSTSGKSHQEFIFSIFTHNSFGLNLLSYHTRAEMMRFRTRQAATWHNWAKFSTDKNLC